MGSASRCCAGYSAVGALFMLFVGVMLSTQPFYIGGIEDVGSAKVNAYGAMILFCVVFAASIFGIMYDSKHKKEETNTNGAEGYQLNTGDRPNYGASRFD